MYLSVCCDVTQKGPTYQKIKLQKIKSGYFSFQGGDFPPMRCVKTRSFLLCYAEPMKYFSEKFSGRGGH
jgi:hypothetical protein